MAGVLLAREPGPGSCRQPWGHLWLGHGLVTAWAWLGHGLGMSCAEMLLQNLGLLGNCGGSTKGFGLKEMMQNDAGWCFPPCPKFKAGISQCLFFLPPRPCYCFPAIGMML